MVEFEVVDVNDLNLAGRVENLLAILLFGLPVLDGCLDCSLKVESELYDSYCYTVQLSYYLFMFSRIYEYWRTIK